MNSPIPPLKVYFFAFPATSAKVPTAKSSTEPPAASIFALASAETLWATTVTFLVNSPLANILINPLVFFNNPTSTKASGVTVAPASNLFSIWAKLTIS